ncbi:MAG: DUF4327 family protein [Phormidesmis sp.]
MTHTVHHYAYSLDMLRDEVRELLYQGIVHRQQPIYTLCQYMPGREWECAEVTLAENDFLQRDRIIDLISHEHWEED